MAEKIPKGTVSYSAGAGPIFHDRLSRLDQWGGGARVAGALKLQLRTSTEVVDVGEYRRLTKRLGVNIQTALGFWGDHKGFKIFGGIAFGGTLCIY